MQPDSFSKSAVEERTRSWLEKTYWNAIAGHGDPAQGVYDAEGRLQRLDSYGFKLVLRKLKIFRWLDRFEFDSFIDIGSGFDHYPHLVNARYGAHSYYSDFAHSLNLPYGGSIHGKLDHAVTLNINRLPFPDDSFDVVLSSEVLEHLVRPIEAIAELLRVSRKYLLMTSLEALSASRWERFLSHLRVDVEAPHVERNFFLLHELEAIFGSDWRHENLWHDDALPASQFASAAEQEAGYAALRDTDAFAAALCRAVSIADHRPGSMGILIVKTKHDAPLRERRADDRELARWLIERTAAAHVDGYRLIKQMRDGTAELAADDRPIAADLLARVCCPDCRGPLTRAGSGLHCAACDTTFTVEHGVPVLYPRGAEHTPIDEVLARLCGNDTRRRSIISRAARRLRDNETPPGALRRLLRDVDRSLNRG